MKAIILRHETRGVNLQIHWYTDEIWDRLMMEDGLWGVSSGESGYVTELSAKVFLQLFAWIPELGTKHIVDLRCILDRVPKGDALKKTIESCALTEIPDGQVSRVQRWKCVKDEWSCDLCLWNDGLVVPNGKVKTIHGVGGGHQCRCVIVEDE